MASRKTSRKRAYSLGKRLEISGRKREKILRVARAQLVSGGFLNLTLDGLARKSGVTRQTIHNLFGTKAGVLEALFDRLAVAGGMQQMREVMQKRDPQALLRGFAKVFTGFWSKDRVFIRRVHGLAAIDPELGKAVAGRNQRRLLAATRIVERLGATEIKARAGLLWALTSFEFFDQLAEVAGSEAAVVIVLAVVEKEIGG